MHELIDHDSEHLNMEVIEANFVAPDVEAICRLDASREFADDSWASNLKKFWKMHRTICLQSIGAKKCG